MQLADWNGIVLASGDGLIFEVNNSKISNQFIYKVYVLKVINGLMNRVDWQEALKLPIGHVPCGSGNAFITNIIRHSK